MGQVWTAVRGHLDVWVYRCTYLQLGVELVKAQLAHVDASEALGMLMLMAMLMGVVMAGEDKADQEREAQSGKEDALARERHGSGCELYGEKDKKNITIQCKGRERRSV